MQPYPTGQNYGYNPYAGYMQQPIMPMQDRLAQLTQNYQNAVPYQTPQPQQQMSYGLNGQMVDSIDVVRVKDVDLSGNPTFYPNVNGDEIYKKQLMADGKSHTTIYRKVEQNDVEKKELAQPSVNMDMLNGLITQLKEDLLNEISVIKTELPSLIQSAIPDIPKTTRGGSQR